MKKVATSQHISKLHMRGTRIIAALVLCTLPSIAASEAHAGSTLEHDFRLWSPVYLTVPLSPSFIGYMEVNPRFGDDVSELDQLLLRPAIGYKLSEHVSLWQGYAWIGNYAPRFIEEHRIFQQLVYSRKFQFVKIFSRSRIEERIIDDADDTAIRARTMLRGDFPIQQFPGWALVLYDEIFVNVNAVGNGPEAGFDQNRFFLGMNHQVSEHFNVDVGYQMQVLNNRQSGLTNQANHVILLQFFINL